MADASPLPGPDMRSPSRHSAPAERGVVGRPGALSSDEIWLTVGEAADAARVAHRQIAAWMASGDLSARTGWRRGAEIRLILLSDLEGLVDEIDLDCIRGALDARGVFTGPAPSVPGADSSAVGILVSSAIGVSGMKNEGPAPTETRPIKPDDRQWASELEQEITRLRGVVHTLRGDHESLERHLDTRVSVVNTRRLGGRSCASERPNGNASDSRGHELSPEAVAAARALAIKARETADHGRLDELPSGNIAGAVIVMAAGVLLGVLGAAFAAEILGDGDAFSSGDQLVLAATRQGSDAPRMEAAAAVAKDAATPNVLEPMEQGPSAGESSILTSGVRTAAAGPNEAPGSAAADEDLLAELAPVEQADVSGRRRRAGLTASNVAPSALAGPTRLHPPMALADIDRAVFSRRSSVLADCAYTRLLEEEGSDPGVDLRGDLVLGPCFGPARRNADDELAVPGTHRVGNVSCCKHHAFVERMTSASTDDAAREGLKAEAAASLAEGVLPPLFRLRADRAASLFLREETRGWERAGFDGSAGSFDSIEARHEWTQIGGPADGSARRVTLESWMQPMQGLDPTMSAGARGAIKPRRFRMTLLIQSAPRGDMLESFEWLVD
ncbi:MAG: hypothetical protein ACJAZN_002883 [Planctomycetota bacterium]|jgi:hypothetical protein